MVRYQLVSFFVFSLFFIAVLSAPAKKEEKKKEPEKKPANVATPMGPAAVKKQEQKTRKALLGLLCFIEFGINNNIYRAVIAGDKNGDGKVTLEEFNDYYMQNNELLSVAFRSKEEMFQMFDKNKNGAIATDDAWATDACDTAKEETLEVLPTKIQTSFKNNLDVDVLIQNEGAFNKVMKPIRKYIIFMYDVRLEKEMTAFLINKAIWASCQDIKLGGIVDCSVLNMDKSKQIAIVRNWIKLMLAWSKKTPMV